MDTTDFTAQVLIFILGALFVGYVLHSTSKRKKDEENKTSGNFPAARSRKFDPAAELPKDTPAPPAEPPKDTQPPPPKPEKVHFPTSGQTFMMFKELGCKEEENSIMTGSNVEVCQVMCSNDSQCGRFTIDDNGDCKMYNICTPERLGGHITLYTRHRG